MDRAASASLLRFLLTSTALAGVAAPLSRAGAQSLPTGASVVSGTVGFGRSSGTLTINQSSQNAVVNYNAFSIGAKNTVNIVQPNSRSAILNRVTGSAPSTIAGHLNANGQVYLVNPNGVAITKTGVVKVGGGFVASTLGMSDAEFNGGRRRFRGDGSSAAVTNAGTVRIGRGGYAALIGGEVRNSGLIAVPMGRVALGSGETATLDVSGDGFLQVAVPTAGGGTGALVSNAGRIAATGGTVVLDAATARAAARNAVNIAGTIDAHSISGHDGAILLGGGAGGAVDVSGTLNVSGGSTAAGGRVAATGRTVAVSGRIDASGRRGGSVRLAASDGTTFTGTVRAIGHGGRGGRVTITGLKIALAGAAVDASGTAGGGTVTVGGGLRGSGPLPHAQTVTVDAASTIRADGTGRGAGGSVVVWSDGSTSFAGAISAQGGSRGGDGGQAEVSSHGVLDYRGTTDLLATHGATGTLLLDPYSVTITSAADSNTGYAAGAYTPTGTSVISNTELQTQLATSNVTITTGAAGSAGTDVGNITVAAPVAWSAGTTLTLTAANAIAIGAPITVAGAGGLALNAATTTDGTAQPLISFAGGASVSYTGMPGQGALTINRQIYTLEYSLASLATDANKGGGYYALARSVDGSNGGSGYAAAVVPTFTGTLEGLGHTVNNLTINSSSSNVGLIGEMDSGTVRDIGLVGGAISGGIRTGGLVGYSTGGTITQSYSTAKVSGSGYTGGLVGIVGNGTLAQSYSTGAVGGTTAGGLVGLNGGTIAQSYSTGAVSGSSKSGGLVGYNDYGTITQSYSTGAVSGSSNVGGLVGSNFMGTITASAYDTTTAGTNVGVGDGSAGVTGLTTQQLAAALPAGFDATGWTNAGNQTTPYLINNVGPVILGTNTSATPKTYTPVLSVAGLQAVNNNLTANYALLQNLDASATSGFTPIGQGTAFTGTFNGLGHTVTNLAISATADNAGLFGQVGSAGTVTSLGLVGGSVTSSGQYVGALVGRNAGTVTLSYSTGTVTGTNYTGGLVGENTGTVSQSFATGAANGNYYVGGLVGFNNGGQVGSAYAMGAVLGRSFVGGLVGNNGGSVTQTYSTGAVTATDSGALEGGLVGYNNGTVTLSAFDRTTTLLPGVGGGSSSGITQLSTSDLQSTATSNPFGSGSGLSGGAAGLGSSTAATAESGVYPYLTNVFPNGVQAVSGTVNFGTTAGSGTLYSGANGAVVVTLDAGGARIGQGTVGAGGYYYIAVANGTLAAGTTLLATTPLNNNTNATNSASLATSTGVTGQQGGLDLYASTFTAATNALTLSGVTSAKVAAAGTDAAALAVANATVIANYNAQGASFTIDQPVTVTTGLSVTTLGGAPLTVAAPITSISAPLTLASGGALAINAPVNAQGAVPVTLRYDASAATNLTFAPGGAVTFTDRTGSPVTTSQHGSLGINGTNYTLLYTMADVAGLNNGTAALANNLDASQQGTYSNAVVPTFGGTLEGLGHTVSGLTINSSSQLTGLIGQLTSSGTVRDIGVNGGTVTGTVAVGGLVGYNNGGTVIGASSTAAVNGTGYVGGLVGYNIGAISRSSAGGAVTGSGAGYNNFTIVGGLVGVTTADGTITQSAATGAVRVSGTAASLFGGGLVGQQDGAITQSYATGSVAATGTGSGQFVIAGGLVGVSDASFGQTYATGAARASATTGATTGSNFNAAGGLIGIINKGTATVTQSYATGTAAASGAPSNFVGGFAGYNSGTISSSAFDTQTTGSNAAVGIGSGTAAALTTAQLQGTQALPAGTTLALGSAFAGGAASPGTGGTLSTQPGLYPYLTNFFPGGVQAITATAQDGTGTALPSAQVGFYSGGTLLGGGTVSSGANGYVYQAVAAGTLATSGGLKVGALVTPAGGTAAAGFTYTDGGTAANNVLALGTVAAGATRETTARTTLSGLGGDVTSTFGAVTLPTPASSATAITATNAAGFTLDQSVTAGGSYAVTTTGGPLTLAQTLAATGRTVTLSSAGTIAQTGGTLAAATLTGSSVGGASFTQANSIAALGAFTDTGNGNLTLRSDAAMLGLTGSVNLGTGTLTLTDTAGAISQTAGTITAGTLSGASRGGASFNQTNSITSLGAFSTGGGAFTLADNVQSLAVTGTVSAGSIVLSNAGRAAGNAVSLSGSLSADSVLVAANGAFTNTGGSGAITAANGFTIYTQDPTNPAGALPANSFGGLAATNWYNDAYDFGSGSFATAVPAGNHFAYAYAATLTPTLSGSASKTYDGTTTASTAGLSLASTGLVNANGVTDAATLALGGASYDTKNAGTGKTVTASGVTLTANPNNYLLGSTSAAAAVGTITPAALTVSGVAVANKTYDGGTVATINSVVAPSGIPGDDVSVDTSGATASFADKNAGAGKAVTVAGITVGGVDAGNYTLVLPTDLTATINQRDLNLSGVFASNKTYDGTTAATLGGTAVVSQIAGDVVSVSGTGAGSAFADKNAGVGKAVTVAGYALTGADAGNYNLVVPTNLTADIAKANLTVSGVTANNKTYDGTTVATLGGTATVSALGSDVVSVSGTGAGLFADKNAGAGKLVTVTGYALSGTDAGNYDVVQPTGLTADIAKATLTVSGVTANSKTYDGTAATTLGGTAAVSAVAGDDVYVAGSGAGTFADKNAGAGKLVTVTGYALGGADAGNYVVAQPAGLTADIARADLAVSGLTANNKVYDGTAAAALAGTAVVAPIGGDVVYVAGTGAGFFADKNAGTGKAVTVTGFALTGLDAGNYNVVQPTGLTADIGRASLNVTGVTANDKTYDGTTVATLGGTAVVSALGSDVVSVSGTGAGFFADKNAGAGKLVTVTGYTLTGADAGNYDVVQPTGLTATIGRASLAVSGVTANSKTYDGTAAATLGGTAAVSAVAGDDVYVAGSGAGTFADKNAGAGKLVTVTGYALGGADAGNYVVAQPAGLTADIARADLAVSGLTANNKVYDGTTAATLGGTAVVAPIGGDVVYVAGTGAGFFADKNAGTGKAVTVTGYALTGLDAGNYNLVVPTNLTADIGRASLNVTGVTANNKTYDGTTVATLGGTAVVSALGSDVVSVSGTGAGLFADKNAGAGKLVTVTGYALSGTDAGNYDVVQPTGLTADIAKATLTVSGVTANNKTYDGTDALTLSGTASVTGFGSDVVSVSGSGTGRFNTVNVGSAIPVSVSGLHLSGVDAGNYDLNLPTLSANITPATLTYTANAASRLYGVANPALTGIVTGFVNSETQAGATTGTLAFTTQAMVGSNVGSYAVVGSGLTANNGNYVFVQAASNATALTVTPASLLITAANQTKTYGQSANLGTAGFTVTGLVNGDAVSSVALASGGAAGTATVGNYSIAASNAAGAGLSNYAVTYAAGTLTVTPATLVITAANQIKTYGETENLGTTAFTTSGLVNGDRVSGVALASGGAAGTANVGGYSIAASNAAGAGLSNYAVTYAAGTLTVGQRAITVAADAQTRAYGDADPALTYTVGGRGLVNGDTLTGGLSTGADGRSAVGTYAITQGSLAASGNYALSYTGNTLAVGQRAITVTAADQGKTYGDANPALTYTVGGRGLVNGDTLTGMLTTGADGRSAVGGYAIGQGTLAASGNYALSYTGSTLAVGQRAITVAAADQGKTYGQSASLGTTAFTAAGLVNGDSVSGVALASGGAARTAGVGGYAITASDAVGTGLSNYAVTYAAGTLTVTPAALLITAANQTKIYGQSAKLGTTAFTAAGLVDGDRVSGVTLASGGAAGTASVGGYAITAANAAGTGLSNYAVTYAPGTLTVTPAPAPVETVSLPGQLPGSTLASTAERAALQALGRPIDGLPLIYALPGGGDTLASQIVAGLSDPRFDRVLVCTGNFCTLIVPAKSEAAAAKRRTSQLEATER